jgi:hypothetical protein
VPRRSVFPQVRPDETLRVPVPRDRCHTSRRPFGIMVQLSLFWPHLCMATPVVDCHLAHTQLVGSWQKTNATA